MIKKAHIAESPCKALQTHLSLTGGGALGTKEWFPPLMDSISRGLLTVLGLNPFG